MILEDYFRIGLSFLIILIYTVVFIFLGRIIKKTKNGLDQPFRYLVLAVLVLILIRVLNLLKDMSIFVIPLLSDILILVFSIFLLLAIVKYHSSLEKLCK